MTARLRIPADVHSLARARRFVEDTAVASGASAAEADALVLAVDELLTNTIEHGYAGGPGEVEIAVALEAEAVVVRLRDTAAPFDPLQAPEPDLTLPLELRPVGGLGIYLVRQLIDEVQHRALPEGGNELTLVKRLSAPAGPAGQTDRQGDTS